MSELIRVRSVAALALVFTYLFFFEYLPPVRRVHVPYDLEGFHYPLVDYAFQALRQGRLPEWDPTIYCGASFAGNLTAALFYPPTWLLFAANLGRQRLTYQSLEDFVLAHVWLAFVLCYVWLRHKRLAALPSVLGAGVFAYSGYMMLQLQHQGLVAGYTWMPLGLWGIDQAVEQRRWQPLGKLIAASALCFLAGYPPTWFVFAVCAFTYAAFGPWRWKAAGGAALSLTVSLLISMVQLLPGWEAARLKSPEIRYGTGIRNPEFFVSYLLPNYFDFGMHVDIHAHPGGEYLYLGAPAFLGLVCLVRRKNRRELIPLLAVAVVSFVALTNPFDLVSALVAHSSLLAEICRDWYFLAGLSLAAAPLAAMGLDHCLQRPRAPAARWVVWLNAGLLSAWALREIAIWLAGGTRFAAGWNAAWEPAITLTLFAAAIYILPGQQGKLRTSLAAALLLAVAVDYKVFGTSKRFNASPGAFDKSYSSIPLPGVDDAVYRQLLAHADYRIALDVTGPFPTELRHCALTTPQGFDPFLSTAYKKLIERIARFREDRLFDIDPASKEALRLLGIRYFITTEAGPLYSRLSTDPGFRRLEPSESYYKVFEALNPQPPYGWVPPDGARPVERREWAPERRAFVVRSEAGGRFALAEQFFPGWQATVDEVATPIERWEEAFQSIAVPPGEHRVEFRFRSSGLRAGAAASLASLLGVLLLKKILDRKTGRFYT